MYWRYVLLGAVLFGLGIALGVALVGVVDLATLLGGADSVGGALPELTFWGLVVNNGLVLVLLLATGLTLGLGTVAILVYNGVIVGYVLAVAVAASGPEVILFGIVPHGVVEIPAFLLAGAVAFRFAHQILAAARGQRTQVMTGAETTRAVALVALAAVCIPIAAYVEAEITTALLETYVQP
jgi:stage II sporulation protein M